MRWLRLLILGLLSLAPLAGALAAADGGHSRLTVEALRCERNVSTSCRFILGYVHLKPGDPVDEQELQAAKLRLLWLRNFSSVDIRLEKGSARGKVVVVVDVTESNTLLVASGFGITSMGGTTSEIFSGRLRDADLLGTGKSLNLDLETRVPSNGLTQEDLFARAQYVDPQLFASPDYFLDAALTYHSANYEFPHYEFFDEHFLETSAEVGRRLGEFAYVTVGYAYRPVVSIECNVELSNPFSSSPTFATRTENVHGTPMLGFGWSDDDPAFPSGGSELHVESARDVSGCGDLAADFRYTWPLTGRSYLSLVAQYPTGGGLSYSHDLRVASWGAGTVRRARWYVEPGFWSFNYSNDQQLVRGMGIRAGVRLDTKTLGVVDLFLFYASDNGRGGVP